MSFANVTLTRSLLTIVVPGIVASSPWLLFLVQHTDATLGFDKNATLSNALVFACVIVAGAFCEGAGTYIESSWDGRLEDEFEVKKHWSRYLHYNGSREPVVFRYLSRLVTTLYYELAMCFAVVWFFIGAFVLAMVRFPAVAIWCFLLGTAAAMLGSAYFFEQARVTHRRICETRQNMELPQE